jgi:WD40 repeat protein
MDGLRDAVAHATGREDLRRWSSDEPVVDVLREWTEPLRMLLVVLDQFEDYFLYHADEHAGEAFERELVEILNAPNLRVNVLISIREDAWAKLDRFEGQIPHLFANYVRVDHLDRPAARKAIERPIDEWNWRLPEGERPYAIEQALVEGVIDAAAAGGLALGEGAVPGALEEIEAPFLQLVMERLWRATIDAGARELTLARLERLGGAQRIVENHLLEALRTLSAREQSVAADLFRFLVTRSKTKIAQTTTDLAEWTGRPEAEVKAVLDKLASGQGGRILRTVTPPSGRGGVLRYELFHDVLGEPVLQWRRAYEQERARRETRRKYLRIGAALLALVAVFAALGIWALVQRNDARRATRSAVSLALASAAGRQLPNRADRSLLLSLAAYRTRATTEAADSMVRALEQAGDAEAILHGHTTGVRAVAFGPDGRTVATADSDGFLRLWDARAHTPLGPAIRAHTDETWSVAFSPDGGTLASTGLEGTVRLWDVARRTPLTPGVDAHAGPVRVVAFSSDGRTLAYAGDDAAVHLWDLRGHAEVGSLRGHGNKVVGLSFSRDGRLLASASYDGTVRLWDVRERKQVGRPLRRHKGQALSVAFSPDGRTLASSGIDGRVLLWRTADGHLLARLLHGEADQVWSVAFSPDGRTLAASGFDKTVRLWDMRTRAPLPPLRGHTDRVVAVAFGPGGTLVSGSYDRTARLWDVGNSRRLGRVAGFLNEGVKSVAFSPDGRTLAVGDDDGFVQLRETGNRSRVGPRWNDHDGAVEDMAFGSDGHTIAVAGDDGAIRIWDVRDRARPSLTLRGRATAVWGVALSPDGETLASAELDGVVPALRLWDLRKRPAISRVLRGGVDNPFSVGFSPDGHTLVVGGVSGSLRLWDARSGRPIGRPLGTHADKVESVGFSPDGRTLASASDDGSVRLWDVGGRRSLGLPLRGHRGAVLAAAFTPDGRGLKTAGADYTVRVWNRILWRDEADLRARVCGLVIGHLSPPEWMEVAPGLDDSYRDPCAG